MEPLQWEGGSDKQTHFPHGSEWLQISTMVTREYMARPGLKLTPSDYKI